MKYHKVYVYTFIVIHPPCYTLFGADDNLDVTLIAPATVVEGEMFHPRLNVSQQVLASFLILGLPGTAAPPLDFIYSPAQIAFAASNISLASSSAVMTFADKLVEPNETFTLDVQLLEPDTLSDVITYINEPWTVTILDNNSECVCMHRTTRSVGSKFLHVTTVWACSFIAKATPKGIIFPLILPPPPPNNHH